MAVKLTWIRTAWTAFGHAVNAYTLAAFLLWLFFGSTVLGVLYAVADYNELPRTSQGLFGVAVFAAFGLIVMLLGPWSWEHRPFRISPATGPLPLENRSMTITEPSTEELLLKLDVLNWQERDPWIYLRVINAGPPDEFNAQVIGFAYASVEQTQYTVKWRESLEPTKKVFKEDLLNLAQIVVPRELGKLTETERIAANLISGGIRERARAEVQFRRGFFRLFSVSEPNGWEVTGRSDLIDFGFGHSTVPPEERPLKVFEEQLRLNVRVTGTRGQEASVWVRLSFERPNWNYDRQEYELGRALAEIVQNAVP